MSTTFHWIRDINPRSGLHLKQPLLITVSYRIADNLWIARAPDAIATAVGSADSTTLIDVFLSLLVTRFYTLTLRLQDLEPDVYDEYRALCRYFG